MPPSTGRVLDCISILRQKLKPCKITDDSVELFADRVEFAIKPQRCDFHFVSAHLIAGVRLNTLVGTGVQEHAGSDAVAPCALFELRSILHVGENSDTGFPNGPSFSRTAIEAHESNTLHR